MAFWGVQLEIGSVATPLESAIPNRNCGSASGFIRLGTCHTGYGIAGAGAGQSLTLPVSMRAAPTLTPSGDRSDQIGTVTLTPLVTGTILG